MKAQERQATDSDSLWGQSELGLNLCHTLTPRNLFALLSSILSSVKCGWERDYFIGSLEVGMKQCIESVQSRSSGIVTTDIKRQKTPTPSSVHHKVLCWAGGGIGERELGSLLGYSRVYRTFRNGLSLYQKPGMVQGFT